MSSYFSTVAQESLCLFKFFHNTKILSPLSSLEALLQQLSCKVTHISFSLITYFADGFFFFYKINGVSSRTIWIIMLILPGSPQESQCNSALLRAPSQFRGSLLALGCTERRTHTLRVSRVILQEFINILATVCSHQVIYFFKKPLHFTCSSILISKLPSFTSPYKSCRLQVIK